MHKKIALVFAFVCSLIAISIVPAQAKSPELGLNSTELDYVTQQFDKLGVSENVRPALLEKISRGELLDAESGAEPIESATLTESGVATTRSVFADGSVSKLSIPVDLDSTSPDTITPFGISGCTGYTDGGQISRLNCKIDYNAVTWSGEYYLSRMGWGPNYTVASGPYGIVKGGLGTSGAAVNVLNGGGTRATAWVRFQMEQTIAFVSRDVGFDLKITKSGGPKLTAFSG